MSEVNKNISSNVEGQSETLSHEMNDKEVWLIKSLIGYLISPWAIGGGNPCGYYYGKYLVLNVAGLTVMPNENFRGFSGFQINNNITPWKPLFHDRPLSRADLLIIHCQNVAV
jgi:hypothetical protein